MRYCRAFMRIGLAMALLVCAATPANSGVSVRLKDLTRIKNVRQNQLFGLGLVIGLNGSGDSGLLARQLTANVLQKLQINIAQADLTSKNVAAVMVTADAPPFFNEGTRLDVLISSIGDAKSLEGGTLLQTPLQGADGCVYAVAQGPLSVGGFAASGEAASVRKNFPTVARVPGGAIAERALGAVFRPGDDIELLLMSPDFLTAVRVADVINGVFAESAVAVDAATVRVAAPEAYRATDRMALFISRIESLMVTPDISAKVIVNERTGTIVAGENVKVSTVAISHGNLTISITEKSNTSQPLPFSSGETRAEKSTDIAANETRSGLHVIENAATIAEVARALNLLGVTPRDMISIFQALKEAGALQGELVII